MTFDPRRGAVDYIARQATSWVSGRLAAAQDRQYGFWSPGFEVDAFGTPVLDWVNGATGMQLADELGAQLRKQGTFLLVQGAWVFAQPTDAEVLNIASAVLPFPYGLALELFRDAVIIAGSPYGEQRQRAQTRAEEAVATTVVRSMFK